MYLETKIIIVPQALDKDGMYDIRNHRIPYGYHHIRINYEDESSYLISTVSGSYSLDIVLTIAYALANGLDVTIDPDYYKE